MNQSHGDLGGEAIAHKNSRNVSDEHAEGGAGDDHERLMKVSGHGDGGDLSLVAHLGQKEGEKSGAKNAKTSGHASLLLFDFVRDEGPRGHAKKREPQGPAKSIGGERGGDPSAQRAGQAMVDQGGQKNAKNDGERFFEASGEHEREKLSFIANLGEGDHAGGSQKSVKGHGIEKEKGRAGL